MGAARGRRCGGSCWRHGAGVGAVWGLRWGDALGAYASATLVTTPEVPIEGCSYPLISFEALVFVLVDDLVSLLVVHLD